MIVIPVMRSDAITVAVDLERFLHTKSFWFSGSFRFFWEPELLRLSVTSWLLLRLELITRSALRMATPWLWTRGAWSWRTVGGQMWAWLWWRLTWTDCRTLEGTCQCSSTGGRKSFTAVWTEQRLKIITWTEIMFDLPHSMVLYIRRSNTI